jgi:hypothetical protein
MEGDDECDHQPILTPQSSKLGSKGLTWRSEQKVGPEGWNKRSDLEVGTKGLT